MLNNIKTMKKDRGFTIVELLIVIVVIAILAAITIVAYNGIQNRAKSSAGQSLANSIQKKSLAYYTLNGSYPTFCQFKTNTTDPTVTGTAPNYTCTAGSTSAGSESKLDDTSSITAAAVTTTTANGGQVVTLQNCGATVGNKIGYWDYAASTPAVVYVYTGTATSSSTCS